MSEPLFIAVNVTVVSVLVALALVIRRRQLGRVSSSTLLIVLCLWSLGLLVGWLFLLLPARVAPLVLASLPASGGVLMLVRRRAIMRETGRDDRYRLYMAAIGFGLAALILIVAASGY
jgi:hypothetical protein